MEETILLYHMDENIKNIIQTLAQQLGVIVKDIDDSLKCQSMGYILGIDGFEKSDELELTDDMEKEFVLYIITKICISMCMQIMDKGDMPH